MKLFHTPGTCSTATRIVLAEAGIAVELIEVDIRNKKVENGDDFLALNPKGQVPALLLENGELLTEGAVIMQYVADQAPATQLLPAAGDLARYRVLEWVNYIATELHKTFSPLYKPNTPPEYRDLLVTIMLPRVFTVLNDRLSLSSYLAGETFTIADAYAYVILGWAKPHAIDLFPWPNLQAYLERIATRPAIRATTRAAEAA
ncbi:glutathione transferase GstA [Agrobacterium rhizogenes]|uniref:glutathione transferase GstA n=1 Tax=Rhizobium rhizogenes TaxID=359 RepID=UPI000DDD7084|nr:glutathione transferase GstA [Rhizobium rhizogenes]KAA6487799.1 glutathione transferase GstA [Agrobacterium sp. ICMP 7243]NTF83897.1 glutathione transferase GstA [Rhizobium rhizogenes]NTF89534.1 glutathione transferase GstA [Rhizobium rhizogenes]NTG03298.1 glutathione transferase GstA [Rhizobium rhizogenes]NTG16780.1 glutathione transferase GstA [Rhizobium rhizogenes]